MRSFSHYCWLSLRDQHSRLLNARSPRAQNTLIGLTCISWTNTLNLCLFSTVLSRQREQRIHPEIALQTHGSQTGKRQKRLGACITGKDGRFSFDPKAGKYELRFSRYDCNVKAVIVEVSKKAHNKTRIEVILEAAT